MKQGKYDETTIEQILQSLDTAQRANVPDFFYTRLRARMMDVQATSFPIMRKPVLVIGALVLMLCMNIFVLLRGVEHPVAQQSGADNETTQLVDAYGLNDASAFTKESDENK